MHGTVTRLWPRFLALSLLVALTGARTSHAATTWKDVDALVSEQKFEAAATEVQKLRQRAQKAGDETEWAKALIREVQLRGGLHGYETAVRFLHEQPWPKGALPRTALLLFEASGLVTYSQAYGWEIGKRERVAANTSTDLKTWTLDQIFAAATRAYVEIWKGREALGTEKVEKFGDYLEANNYPREIRGTLRDAVSYVFVDLLANTQGWRPEQSNEVFTLDRAALIKGNVDASKRVKLDDPAVHPLVKLGAIFDDLEAWHQQRKEADAAIEVRLARARTLFNQFSEDSDRDAVLKDLEARLPAWKDRPWWSMAAGTLAGLQQQRNDLIGARATADAGAKAFPDSPGGQLCRSIVSNIDLPSYQVASMLSDGARRRSLEVTHRNLPALWFRAYPLDLERRLSGSDDDESLLPSAQQMKKLVGTKPVAEWSTPLPPTTDFKPHKTFVTPPLDKLGLYAIVVSGRQDFAPDNNALTATSFLVTNLVMLNQRHEDGTMEVTVVDGASGAPVPGAEVLLYRTDYSSRRRGLEATQKTDAQGAARFFVKSTGDHLYFLLARHHGSYALDREQIQFYRPTPPGEETEALVYTDRGIYRPMQKLFFKAVVWKGRRAEARLHTVAGKAVTVSLSDPNGQVVDKREATTNAFGSIAGEFTIPTGRLLGNWSLTTSVGGGANVRVEEYKRPTFEVALIDSKAALRLNQTAKVEGEVKYYFGLPVTNGAVRWHVTREPVYPPWWGWYWETTQIRAQTVATGTAKLDATGHFRFEFTPKADARAASTSEQEHAVSYRYRAVADVTDEGGETRTAERAFRLGFVSVEARLEVGTGFVRAAEAAEAKAVRTDLDGIPRTGKGTYRLMALKQPSAAVLPADEPRRDAKATTAKGDIQTPGDRQRARWDSHLSNDRVMRSWADGAMLATGALAHDATGVASIPLPKLNPGAYRLRYETQDDFGARYQTQTEFLVAGANATTTVALPAVLLAEKPVAAVGGTARLLVSSGWAGQVMTLDVWRAGKRVLQRRLIAGKDPAVIELPVKDADRGGFGVTLNLLRDYQLMTATTQVMVPWDDRELQVTLGSFRDNLRPGAKETWKVTVKGPPAAKPEAAAAEILAYMYDRSLDLFGPHTAPSPMDLWPSRVSLPSAHSSLGQAWSQWIESRGWPSPPSGPNLHGDSLKSEDGYGIGGMGMMGGFGSNVRMRRGHLLEGGAAPMMAMPAPAPPSAPGDGDVAKMEAPRQASLRAAPKMVGNSASVADGPEAPVPVRSNFSETAFWRPNLLTGPDGSASLEFTVPDSVTSWNVWVHAVTKDLLSGSLHKQTQSVKDLMVRPAMPRFLREGDRAELKVVVNNASAGDLAGELHFALADPDTGRDLAADFGLKASDLTRPFKVLQGRGTNVTFTLNAPRQVRQASLKITATAGNLSDGELRALPVLPSRVHLVQSRFVTLRDKDKRELTFKDLTSPDASRINDQLVVTVDAQLFTTVLQALPYLVTYPYECTEQTLNRFVSSAIVGSVFRDFPGVAKMAAALSKRSTPLETFDAADPNRKMALEESPWLSAARGDPLEPGSKNALVNVLDPKLAAAERAASLAKLRKAQLESGAFPWFPGGPADPYMTLYILYGFAKATEFKIDLPKDMVQQGWRYLAQHFRAERGAKHLMANDCCWEWLTFLNYAASAYPDPSWTDGGLTADERKEILAFSFKHWKQHSPYLKGLLALTLKRAGRAKDAKLVWGSVMDSAKTKPDLGTFWAPEDRSWLWYNDTIETQAFALRALLELEPSDSRKDGLALWLLLNKKLNQWKSTRATAEVIYSLVHYLKGEKALGVRENARVTVGGKTTEMVFEPDTYTGKKNQIVLPGPEVGPKTATVTVEKDTKGFAFASATWHFSTETPPKEERGDFFAVSRSYFRRENNGKEFTLSPLREGATLKPGDELEVHLSLRSKHAAEYVHLRDPRGAGFEPENAVSRYKWDLGLSYYEETRDSGANFFFSALPAGEYTFKYRVRANMAGTFQVGPATVQSIYAPEFNAYSTGAVLKVGSAN